MELIIRQPRPMMTYPTHFHNPIIPKAGLSARGHYILKKQILLATHYLQKRLHLGVKIGPYGDKDLGNV